MLGDVEVFAITSDESRYTMPSEAARMNNLEFAFGVRLAEVLEEK